MMRVCDQCMPVLQEGLISTGCRWAAAGEQETNCSCLVLGRIKKSVKTEGALDRARTDDLRLIRATRYQLRYESSMSIATFYGI